MLKLIPVRCSIGQGETSTLEKAILNNAEDGDIVVIASKAVSYTENRLVRLSDVKPSAKAKAMAKKYNLEPKLAELVLSEADEVIGGFPGFITTIKFGTLCPNAGIDRSNVPAGFVILYPKDPKRSARNLVEKVRAKTGKRIGIVIADSRILPLRKGVTGIAIATHGFESLTDERGKPDLYGKKLKYTFRNVADMLASASELLMGESSEMTPIIIVRGLETRFTDDDFVLNVKKEECLYMRELTKKMIVKRKKK